MTIVLGLLLTLGCIGAVDHILYHVGGRLHHHVACRWELLSHAGHGLLMAAFFLCTMVEASGAWAMALMGLAVAQLANQAIDAWIEPSSRVATGGIRPGEYRMHAVIHMLWGAVLTCVAGEALAGLTEPTALRWVGSPLTGALAAAPLVGAVVATAVGLVELAAFVRLSLPRSSPATRPVPPPPRVAHPEGWTASPVA